MERLFGPDDPAPVKGGFNIGKLLLYSAIGYGVFSLLGGGQELEGG